MEDGRWKVTVGDETFIVSGDATVEHAPGTIFNAPKPSRSDLHPTQKPVDLCRKHLRNSARPGDIVIDAFGGSGSTAVAAHLERMKSRLMELDPKYVDVIVRRGVGEHPVQIALLCGYVDGGPDARSAGRAAAHVAHFVQGVDRAEFASS